MRRVTAPGPRTARQAGASAASAPSAGTASRIVPKAICPRMPGARPRRGVSQALPNIARTPRSVTATASGTERGRGETDPVVLMAVPLCGVGPPGALSLARDRPVTAGLDAARPGR